MTTVKMYDSATDTMMTFHVEMDGCAPVFRDLEEEREVADLEDRYYEEMAAEHYAAEDANASRAVTGNASAAAAQNAARDDSPYPPPHKATTAAARSAARKAASRAARGIPISDRNAVAADFAALLDTPYPAQRNRSGETLSARELARVERDAVAHRRRLEQERNDANAEYAFHWHRQHG